MNDYQLYLLARQRIDQLQRIDHLHVEAMALGHGPGVPRRLADSLRALADWMRIPGLLRSPIAAAAVLTVFAVVVWAPAWAQAPAPASLEKTWEMMGADSEVRPRLQGYLLDNGDFTIYDPFNEIAPKVRADPDVANQGGLLTRDGKVELPAGAFPLEIRIATVLKDGEISDPADAGNWIIIVQRVEHTPRLTLPDQQVWSANTRSALL